MKIQKKHDHDLQHYSLRASPVKNKIVHTNPVSSCEIILIDAENGNILNNNTKTIRNKKLDKHEILRQISHTEKIPTSSYREGVILLPPGCIYTHDIKSKSSEIKIAPYNTITPNPNSTDDPFEILASSIAIERSGTNDKKLVVRFSGGADSTCLLLAAIEVAGADRVAAVTWIDSDFSANSDCIAAMATCKTLQINHLFFRFEPRHFFQPIDPDNHLLITPGMASDQVFENERYFISFHLGDDYIILDGHGGDHVFLDPVPTEAFQDLFRRKKIIKAFKIATKISKMTGSSIYETLFRNRRQRNNESDQRSDFFNAQITPPLTLEKPETLRKAHQHAIIEAISQNATSKTFNKETKIIFPFTSKEMIEYALKQDPYNMFDEFLTRLPLRRAIAKRYPTIPLRSDKGHITSAYQRGLRLHKNRILTTLKYSWLAKNNLINLSHIETMTSRSAMGIGGVDQLLLKIICASLIKEP